MKRTDSSAYAQIAAQVAMLEKFGASIGCVLRGNQLLFDGVLVQVDGYSETEREVILAECWAHIGKAKVAQKQKIASDILKLSLACTAVRRTKPGRDVKCHILFADEEAADVIRGGSWLAAAARSHGITPHVVQLDAEMIETIKQAQIAQDLRTLDKANGSQVLSGRGRT